MTSKVSFMIFNNILTILPSFYFFFFFIVFRYVNFGQTWSIDAPREASHVSQINARLSG